MSGPSLGGGRLSGKILALTIGFVLLGEVLIYLPSIARFRLTFLQERIAAAHLATIALEPEHVLGLAPEAEADLLRYAGVVAITLHRPMAELMLGEEVPVDRTFDLTGPSPMRLVPDAVETLLAGGSRVLRVMGHPPQAPPALLVDVVLPEAPLRAAMVDYSARILTLSLVLSAIVASLLFLSLQVMIVRPLRRITGELAAFRERPEDAAADPPPARDRRDDEIGVVEAELARMRRDLRRALAEKARLAALGSALGRMSHDLRNILSTAVLVSDRLEASADPQVRQVAPRLVESLDRATRLCADTLGYARSRPEAPTPRPFRLAELAGRLRASLANRPEPVRWRLEVGDEVEILADPDQVYRVLLNLARNACEAMGEAGGELRLTATADTTGLAIEVADTGPGIPEQVRDRIFEPFAGSTKPDGSGLGLAICRELARAQGGDIDLRQTGPGGTIFRLTLPPRAVLRGGADPRRRSMTTAERVASCLTLLAALGGCASGGPGIAGYDGLQFRVISFYDARAMEESATCPQPRMRSVTRAQVVEETPERVVMNIKYFFKDEGQINDNDDGFPQFGGGGFLNRCNGFGERTFTFARRTDGNLDVASMTGPQRRLGPDSVFARQPAGS